jgi:hypothetical protein
MARPNLRGSDDLPDGDSMTHDPIREALAELVRLFNAGEVIYAKTAGHVAFAAARAALAAPVAQPATDDLPTPAMCRAAVIYVNGPDIYERVPAKVTEIEEGIYAEVWKAMQAAAPVVAQPLTDEQIRNLWLDAGLCTGEHHAFTCGVKEAEFAHGIGSKHE